MPYKDLDKLVKFEANSTNTLSNIENLKMSKKQTLVELLPGLGGLV